MRKTDWSHKKIRSPSLYWFHRKNWISQPQLGGIESNQSTRKTTKSIEDFHSQYLRIENRSSASAFTFDSSSGTFPLFENGKENSIKKLFDDNNRSTSTSKNKENSGLMPSTTSGNKKLYLSDESCYVDNNNNNKNNIITKKKLISSTNKGQMLVDDDDGDTETTLASGSFTLLSTQKRKDNNFIVDAVSKSGSPASGEVNNKTKEEKTKHNQR